MLMPKKVKYRKQQRGNRQGFAQSGNELSFGEYGLKSLGRTWITSIQIEAARDPGIPTVMHQLEVHFREAFG